MVHVRSYFQNDNRPVGVARGATPPIPIAARRVLSTLSGKLYVFRRPGQAATLRVRAIRRRCGARIVLFRVIQVHAYLLYKQCSRRRGQGLIEASAFRAITRILIRVRCSSKVCTECAPRSVLVVLAVNSRASRELCLLRYGFSGFFLWEGVEVSRGNITLAST